MIAIVAGVPEELAEVRRRLAGAAEVDFGAGRAWRGTLYGHEVVLAVAGDGPARAERIVERLLDTIPCTGVLGLGVAGGLTEDVRAETLVVASRVVGAEGLPEPAWVDAARRHGASPVCVVGASELAVNAVDKARLRERAGDEPAVVDLESAAWAEAARARGLPWSVLRVVSDAWDEEIPRAIVRARRPDGSIARGAVVARALVNPTRIPDLLRLAARVRRASVRLAEGAGAIMSEAPA